MKTFKPTTASLRQTVLPDLKKVLTAKKPSKKLTHGFSRSAGRNAFGRITSRRRSNGSKRRYREIDFKMDKYNIPFVVETVEYDPNRSGLIGLVCYKDGERRYILLSGSMEVGKEYIVSEEAKAKPGNRLPLKAIPIGTFVNNVELRPGQGAKLARGAGTYLEIVAKDAGYVDVKMPSSEIRKISERAWATVGEVSLTEHKLRSEGKAGRNRWKGRRPKVRGKAMNSVDHPQGGGEAAGRGRRKRKKSKWGKVVDPGKKTRTPKKYSNIMIVARRKSKKRG